MERFEVWGVICMLVGAAFAVNALRIYRRRRAFLVVARPAMGTVESVRVEGAGRNRVAVPTIRFTLDDGTTRSAETLLGSGFQRYDIGQRLAVRFDPRDPGRMEVDTFAALWGLPLLRAGFAAVFLLMGGIALVVSAAR